MAHLHREMASRNQANHFVRSHQFHHGGLGESRPFLNHQHMPPQKSIPIASFNPAVPPPRFNVTSLAPSSSNGTPNSHSYSFGEFPNVHVPPQFPARGTVSPYVGQQKVLNNTPLTAPFCHGKNVPFPFPPHMIPLAPTESPQSTSPEESDRLWVKQWLEGHHIKPSVTVPKKTIKIFISCNNRPSKKDPRCRETDFSSQEPRLFIPKNKVILKTQGCSSSYINTLFYLYHSKLMAEQMQIAEARKLFQKWLSLIEQLTIGRDDLIKNIDSPNNQWNENLARTNEIKNELLSVQETLSDPIVINNLQEKICERKKKRQWFKNRMKRRYVEKLEDENRRERLHKEIDKWQNEKREKDLAARKEASLKHEAGGVLGEVRRKQHDGRKLLELLKSMTKLREIRKSEGEKKGVYPKTTLEDDRKFTEKSEYIKSLVSKRIQSYEGEEKALRVMMVEEEEEREKKEEQERLEQKALLNLSKECDPLADFRRYYGQSEERVEYLIQIRREWDAYLVPNNVLGSSRIPNEEISPCPPSSELWSSVLTDGSTDT